MAAVRYSRYRVEPRLAEILGRLSGTPAGQDLSDRLGQLPNLAPPSPTGDSLHEALRAHLWLLDHAAEGGLPLTAARYLKPVDVVALAEVVPTMQDWLGPVSREVDVHPLRHFRASMQSAGLLRKYKGTLLLTKLGRQLRQDPVRLWTHLRDRLVPADPPFDETACLVLLLRAATTPAGRLHIGAIAETMGLLGWAHSGGQPVTEGDVWPVWNDLWVRLGNVGPGTAGQVADRTLSEAALSLVRDALLDEAPVLGVVR